MGIIYPFKDSSDTKTLEKNTILMWIQVIIAILSVYIILSARSVTKKNSYWVRPAIRQMLGNRVQWKYKKKPIGHMSTFIRISSADINDWSNAIRRQKRPTWSQYWYPLYTYMYLVTRLEGSGRELICLVRIRFYVFYVFRVECIRVAGAAQFLRGMIPKHEGWHCTRMLPAARILRHHA